MSAENGLHRWGAGAAIWSLFLALGLALLPVQVAGAAPDGGDKIRDQVQQQLQDKGRADFWVRFADRPDLSPFADIDDWGARGEAVWQALRQASSTSQAQARALLDREGVSYQAFTITNALRVSGGDLALVQSLASSPAVEGIYPPVELTAPVLDTGDTPAPAVDGVEWGISDIKADDVWANYGVLGEGIVVGNIDSGVQYDHPALVEHYRGNNGDGSFSHDYNWFDASGFGLDEPEDFEGHGTHVMGTMVGDDGGSNKIGVAPGATWVATNGCCVSDASLIASGEWMLAPTDRNGEDPQPALRPHVINNSWGSSEPSNDPFMEDVFEAWAAAGQFGVFANGNSGPSCETSGSPGSRVLNYSVGNYTVDHEIAPSSGRGEGQDGEIKPNVSAPGTNVRSSVPGNGYEEFTGTSMASPHVAGTVALLWSAAPDILGDVEVTRALLDGSAVDTEDLQCGGTAQDNNVFGEGRLDALAVLDSAPIGDVGRIVGSVTDADTGEPLAGAEMQIEGATSRTLRTDADGGFQAVLKPGDYTVTADLFGYLAESVEVTLATDERLTLDLGLTRAPTATVTGTVTDDGGHGWPLYAAVGVPGTPVLTYTDPVTGRYSVDLPRDRELTLQATAQYPGYEVGSQTLAVPGDTVLDLALPVLAQECTAPGYVSRSEGLSETFDEPVAPQGWSVEDGAGNGQTWVFDDPAGRGNQTGGEGGFAIVDSDFYGPGTLQDTSLVSPVVDLSALSDPVLAFDQSLIWIGVETADVDLSLDGGATWETIATYQFGHEGPEHVVLPLPGAGGQSAVSVRFHYYDADFAFWWQVDNVLIGEQFCDPVQGGLVVGTIGRTLDDAGVIGARVSNVAVPREQGVSVATPADPALPDGFYWLFSQADGASDFEATARSYASQTRSVEVVPDAVSRVDFELASGALDVQPSQIDTDLVLGQETSADLTVTNTGDADVALEIGEVGGGFTLADKPMSGTSVQDLTSRTTAKPVSIPVDASYAALGQRVRGPAQPAQRLLGIGTLEEPWVDLPGLPEATVDSRLVSLDGRWYSIGGNGDAGPSDAVWVYDPAAMEWSPAAPLPQPVAAPSAVAVDDSIVVIGGWTDSDVTAATWIYDPADDSWTAGADSPVAASAQGHAVHDGQVYVVGGCSTNDCVPMLSTVTAYDLGTDSWTELGDYPEPAAFGACSSLDSSLYCAGGVNDTADLAATYALGDDGSTWTEAASAPTTIWASASAGANDLLILNGGIQDGDLSNATWAYDASADEWLDLPASRVAAFRGPGACGFVRAGGIDANFSLSADVELLPGLDACNTGGGMDVPWLSVEPTVADLAPGESVSVTVTTSAQVAQPGVYSAALRVAGDVPDGAVRVPVTMTVQPPGAWGKLLGSVLGADCDGAEQPLAAAGVLVDPVSVPDFPGWYLETDAEGDFARWFDTRVGNVDITASKDGYRPGRQDDVQVPRGSRTRADFTLLLGSCDVDPGPIVTAIQRLAGADRYLTAIEVSHQFEPGVQTVYLATGTEFPDALGAAARAGSVGVPLLLTRGDALPEAVQEELRRLDPTRIYLLGGPGAIAPSTLEQVRAAVPAARVDRVGGQDRYETAALVARQFDAADTVFVATGESYPDALAGAAAAGAGDSPLLLVRQDEVPDAVRAELERLAPQRIVVLGGEAALSEQVHETLAGYGTLELVAGANRYETAVLLAADTETAADVMLASGENWPDGLAGAALAAHRVGPLVFTRPDTVPPVTFTALETWDPAAIWVLGGERAVAVSVMERLAQLE